MFEPPEAGAQNVGQAQTAQAAAQTAASSTPSMTSSFQGSLRFNPPKNFNGKEDEFEQFAYKLRAYMALSNPKFRKILVAAQESEDPVDFDILEGDEQIMSAQLQNLSLIHI